MMTGPTRVLLATLCVTFAVGCAGRDEATGVPALRVADTASTKEISNIVGTALGVDSVVVANDVLTTRSWFALGRDVAQRVDQSPELGRNLERPERFQLIRDGNTCFLVHERTGLSWLLTDTDCSPE